MSVGDITYIKVDPYVLTNSAATVYTIPSNNHVVSMELVLCNTTANAQETIVYFINSGSSAADSKAVIKHDASTGLTDGETRWLKFNQFLGAGDFIQMLNNNGTAVTAHLSIVLRATA